MPLMPAESFQTLAARWIPAIEAEMRAVLAPTPDQPAAFAGMLHYHMGWVDAQFNPTDDNGGKRIRPLLCLLTAGGAGGSWEQALPGGAALELVHNFSLIHDDIQDASPTRRGRPTVWTIWGAPQAINTGDAMFAAAHIALGRLADRQVPAERVVRALRRFDDMCVELTVGQHLDMSFETREAVGVDEYMRMISGKTAALLAYSAELGAIIAGADGETTNHYAQLGRELGLAFQVLDDILGIWGDEAVIGKSAATDIVNRKKTLPVLYGLERSGELRALYDRPVMDIPEAQFVQKAIALLDQCGAQEFARQSAEQHSNAARHHLQAANPHPAAATPLHQLTDFLLQRQH